MLTKRHNIQPCSLRDKRKLTSRRLRPGLDILCSTRLQEQPHIIGINLPSRDQNLEAHHQNKRNLILLEQPTIHVFVHMLRQELNDDLDTLGGRLDFVRVVDRLVEEHQELLETAVVHPVHEGDLDHGEVEGGTTDSH
jgi:hypothetical protein